MDKWMNSLSGNYTFIKIHWIHLFKFYFYNLKSVFFKKRSMLSLCSKAFKIHHDSLNWKFYCQDHNYSINIFIFSTIKSPKYINFIEKKKNCHVISTKGLINWFISKEWLIRYGSQLQLKDKIMSELLFTFLQSTSYIMHESFRLLFRFFKRTGSKELFQASWIGLIWFPSSTKDYEWIIIHWISKLIKYILSI